MKQTHEQMQKTALGVLWKCFNFNKSDMAKAAGVERQTVYNWFRRGRISATAALRLEHHSKVMLIISKEEMRPDVTEWYGV
jgi:transposase